MKTFKNPAGPYKLDAFRVLSELAQLGSSPMRVLQRRFHVDPNDPADDREKWRLVALLAGLEHDGQVGSGLVAGVREFARN